MFLLFSHQTVRFNVRTNFYEFYHVNFQFYLFMTLENYKVSKLSEFKYIFLVVEHRHSRVANFRLPKVVGDLKKKKKTFIALWSGRNAIWLNGGRIAEIQ